MATARALRDDRDKASSTLIPVSEYLSTTYRPDWSQDEFRCPKEMSLLVLHL